MPIFAICILYASAPQTSLALTWFLGHSQMTGDDTITHFFSEWLTLTLVLLLCINQDKDQGSFDLGGDNDGAALLCLYSFWRHSCPCLIVSSKLSQHVRLEQSFRPPEAQRDFLRLK